MGLFRRKEEKNGDYTNGNVIVSDGPSLRRISKKDDIIKNLERVSLGRKTEVNIVHIMNEIKVGFYWNDVDNTTTVMSISHEEDIDFVLSGEYKTLEELYESLEKIKKSLCVDIDLSKDIKRVYFDGHERRLIIEIDVKGKIVQYKI